MAFENEMQRLENAYAQGRATARAVRDFAGICPYRPEDARLRAAWLSGFSIGRGDPRVREAQPV